MMEIFPATHLPRVIGVSEDKPPVTRNRRILVSLLLAGPVAFYLVCFWLVRPLSVGSSFSLSLAAPVFFLLGLTLIADVMPPEQAVGDEDQVGIDKVLTTVVEIMVFIGGDDEFRRHAPLTHQPDTHLCMGQAQYPLFQHGQGEMGIVRGGLVQQPEFLFEQVTEQ